MIRRFGTILSAVLWLIIYTAVTGFSQQGTNVTVTLDGAISYAMEHNRDIQIAQEDLNKADQQVREAKSGVFPQIHFSSLYTRSIQKPAFFINFGGEIRKMEMGMSNAVQSSISANQLLYSSGQVGAAIQIAKLYSSSFVYSVEQTEKNVKLQVRQSFLAVLLTQEMLRVANRSLSLAERHYAQVQILLSRGAASDFDLLRAEVQAANARPMVLSLENNVLLRKNVLKNIIGMPLGQEIELQGELSPQFIEETNVKQTAAQAFSQRSDYKNISLIRDAMEYRIKIERGSALPMVSFGYTYQFNGQSESFSFGSHNLVNSQNAALTISFPIFDGGKSSARIQQVKIDVQKMDYQLIKMKEAIEVQATQAWNMMSDAHKRMDALEKTVGQAEKAYSIAQVRYESGQGTQLELFDAQVALETAQFNRLQSIFDYESARALWENAIGN